MSLTGRDRGGFFAGALALFFCAAALSPLSCGYRHPGEAAADAPVWSVTIPVLKNRTTEPGLEPS